jgi:hypothetical protein
MRGFMYLDADISDHRDIALLLKPKTPKKKHNKSSFFVFVFWFLVSVTMKMSRWSEISASKYIKPHTNVTKHFLLIFLQPEYGHLMAETCSCYY